MAHFAKIDSSTHIVIDVNVVNNEDVGNLEFPDSEAVGIAFLEPWNTEGTYWKQTSYNNNFRTRYAGIGMLYSSEYDAFIHQQPFPSWVFNTDTLTWIAPTALPTAEDENTMYYWDEETLSWVLYDN